MRDKTARRNIGRLAVGVRANLDRFSSLFTEMKANRTQITDLRQKNVVAHIALVSLTEQIEQDNADKMVALQNVEAMLLTRISKLTERVKTLEGLQWTAEELLGEEVVNGSSDD